MVIIPLPFWQCTVYQSTLTSCSNSSGLLYTHPEVALEVIGHAYTYIHTHVSYLNNSRPVVSRKTSAHTPVDFSRFPPAGDIIIQLSGFCQCARYRMAVLPSLGTNQFEQIFQTLCIAFSINTLFW